MTYKVPSDKALQISFLILSHITYNVSLVDFPFCLLFELVMGLIYILKFRWGFYRFYLFLCCLWWYDFHFLYIMGSDIKYCMFLFCLLWSIFFMFQLLCQRRVVMPGGTCQQRNFFLINIKTMLQNTIRELIPWMFGLTLVCFCAIWIIGKSNDE